MTDHKDSELEKLGAMPLDGIDVVRNRFFNKGTAFTEEERALLSLDGILPTKIETMDEQLQRVWSQFILLPEPINRYQLLRSIQATNNTLYYAFILRHMVDVLPVIYTPAVGEACLKFGSLYQREHGLYLATSKIGTFRKLLDNTRRNKIDVIVITDGSRILGLGDLGTNGMGISIGKCSLYVAAAGVHPRRVLPIVYDSGTDNLALRNDPVYLGQRIPRVHDDKFYEGLDEFMIAVKEKWPEATVQFEDWSNNHCFAMLDRYRRKYRCFNDDIQGTGAVISAGFFNAIKISELDALQHRILVFGAGSAAIGVLDAIIDLLVLRLEVDREALHRNIYLVDTKGLLTTHRGDVLSEQKARFARSDIQEHHTDLLSIIKLVRPTALIGLAAAGPSFTQPMVEFMCTCCPRPIIFPLSNPTSKSEIAPADAYAWSRGKAIVASGSPYPSTTVDGKVLRASQGNNLYIFPGVGLGCSLAQPSTISDMCLTQAASTLADLASDEELRGEAALYPPLSTIRTVSCHIAAAVILQTQREKVGGGNLPTTRDELLKVVAASMWNPQYLDFTKVHPYASVHAN